MKYVPDAGLADYREANTPAVCPLLGVPAKWVVDHDHASGFIRGVISSEGNCLLGRIENAYLRLSKGAKMLPLAQVLRNMADYIERPHTGVMHPEGTRQLCKRFQRATKEEQVRMLREVGITTAAIKSLKNSVDRRKVFRKVITGK